MKTTTTRAWDSARAWSACRSSVRSSGARGVGHTPMAEAPERTARFVLDFARSVDEPGA